MPEAEDMAETAALFAMMDGLGHPSVRGDYSGRKGRLHLRAVKIFSRTAGDVAPLSYLLLIKPVIRMDLEFFAWFGLP